jgi:hypothetical protein
VHWQNGWPKKWFYWYIFLVVQTDPDITRALNDETDGAFKELIEERKIFHLSAFGRVGNWKPWGARNEEMTFGNGSFH